ncbi:MAG: hypothetical protein H6732_05820 [Alphaproteobacteria bacterium]|nr:hypothetical protein [Alphaproteobacteria bacterium]
MRGAWSVCAAMAMACGPGGSDVRDVSGLLEVVARKADGLARPQDLAFDPWEDDLLWVVNRRDRTVTFVEEASSDAPRTSTVEDPYAVHFMERVSSIAFGAPRTFGTCQDGRNTYGGAVPGDGFMGPALWSADRDIFATSNPEAVEYLTNLHGMPTDLGSHLDMLHESPFCVGIAWEADNVYWVFDGSDGAVVRYDFQTDHGVGYDDHSDGIIARYAPGSLSRVSGTVGHVVFDQVTRRVLVADSGNGRIAVLDADAGARGAALGSKEPGVDHHLMADVQVDTLVDGQAVGLERPAGLWLVDDHLVATDAATGHVFVFDAEGGLVAELDTGLGPDALAGVTGRSLEDLWLVDVAGNRVLRLRW